MLPSRLSAVLRTATAIGYTLRSIEKEASIVYAVQKIQSEFGVSMILVMRIIGILCLLTIAASAADWPHWRGPDRNDYSSENSRWTDDGWLADQPRWIAEVGEGRGSPLVIGDKVYSFSWREKQETLMALEADSGQQIWSVS